MSIVGFIIITLPNKGGCKRFVGGYFLGRVLEYYLDLGSFVRRFFVKLVELRTMADIFNFWQVK